MSELRVDQKKLAIFIHELNVARRFIVSYPANHPLLVAAEQRVTTLGAQLLAETGPFALGVTKDALLLGGEILDNHIAAYQVLGRLLFSHGVVAITFSPGVSSADFHHLNEILGRKPILVRDSGGIAALLAAVVTTIQLREIDYDAFTVTNDLDSDPHHNPAEGGLWHGFVQAVLEGLIDPSGRDWQGVDLEDVDTLMQIAQEHGGASQVKTLIANYCRALANIARHLRQISGNSEAEVLLENVGRFIEGMTPELRQQFLQSTLATLAENPEASSILLESMNPELVLSSLAELSQQGTKLPPLVLGLLQTLARHAGVEMPAGLLHEQESGERLRELFREDDLDQFVPEAYRAALHRVLAGDLPMVSALPPAEITTLLETTSGHVLEAKTSDIIIEILQTCPDEAMVAVLQRNLLEMCGYFLEMGDFARLIELHQRLNGTDQADPLMAMVKADVLGAFSSAHFIQEVFHGLNFWGKTKYLDIQKLIATVGEPFVEPLLERLAEEQNMSLRRFYMDRLLEIGPVVEPHILSRLRDNRWFYVRNLLVMLRGVNNPLICKQVHRLFNHPHPRVRTEVLRTLLHYGDAEADKMLLQQLASSDEETLYTALQLAEKSTNPRVFSILLSFLDRGSLTNYEYKLKSAVVSSLAEIGNPAALPRLEQILQSGSLLHAGNHTRLKAEITRSLDHYPPAAVLPILRKIIEKGSSEQVRQAEEVYRLIQRKVHGSSAEN